MSYLRGNPSAGLDLPPYRTRLSTALQRLRSFEMVTPEAVTMVACEHVVERNELSDLYRTVAYERNVFSRYGRG